MQKASVAMADTFKIAGRPVGQKHAPFIIAEMSGNHNQSLERALEIVEAAALAGADAIKVQTYTPDTMTLDIVGGDFTINDPASLWAGSSLYSLYQSAFTPWDWLGPIFKRARELGIIPFSTPFDDTAVDYLETLDTPCYKIASFENTDLSLIQRVAATGKPVIISTGMANVSELDEAVRVTRKSGCRHLVLLKCTSSYPASPENTNILTIPHMRDLYGCEVGLSDHTLGVGVSIASVALGATVIEKHFTLDRNEGGVDSAFSVEPFEMAQLVAETKRAWQSLGSVKYGPTESERNSLGFRRSLYVVADMTAGEAFSNQNLRAIRPGYGLEPKYLNLLLGKRVSVDVKRGTPVTWSLLG